MKIQPILPSSEIPKHKKRNNHKSPKKAKHKHIYYQIICRILLSKTGNSYMYMFGNKCSICSKVVVTNPITEKLKSGHMMLDKKEILKKYCNLEFVDVEW